MAKAKKTPEYKRLINRCRRLWDGYLKHETKTNLLKVKAHLDKMAESDSALVKKERSKCLRAFNAEWKAKGYKGAKSAPKKRGKKHKNPGGDIERITMLGERIVGQMVEGPDMKGRRSESVDPMLLERMHEGIFTQEALFEMTGGASVSRSDVGIALEALEKRGYIKKHKPRGRGKNKKPFWRVTESGRNAYGRFAGRLRAEAARRGPSLHIPHPSVSEGRKRTKIKRPPHNNPEGTEGSSIGYTYFAYDHPQSEAMAAKARRKGVAFWEDFAAFAQRQSEYYPLIAPEDLWAHYDAYLDDVFIKEQTPRYTEYGVKRGGNFDRSATRMKAKYPGGMRRTRRANPKLKTNPKTVWPHLVGDQRRSGIRFTKMLTFGDYQPTVVLYFDKNKKYMGYGYPSDMITLPSESKAVDRAILGLRTIRRPRKGKRPGPVPGATTPRGTLSGPSAPTHRAIGRSAWELEGEAVTEGRREVTEEELAAAGFGPREDNPSDEGDDPSVDLAESWRSPAWRRAHPKAPPRSAPAPEPTGDRPVWTKLMEFGSFSVVFLFDADKQYVGHRKPGTAMPPGSEAVDESQLGLLTVRAARNPRRGRAKPRTSRTSRRSKNPKTPSSLVRLARKHGFDPRLGARKSERGFDYYEFGFTRQGTDLSDDDVLEVSHHADQGIWVGHVFCIHKGKRLNVAHIDGTAAEIFDDAEGLLRVWPACELAESKGLIKTPGLGPAGSSRVALAAYLIPGSTDDTRVVVVQRFAAELVRGSAPFGGSLTAELPLAEARRVADEINLVASTLNNPRTPNPSSCAEAREIVSACEEEVYPPWRNPTSKRERTYTAAGEKILSSRKKRRAKHKQQEAYARGRHFRAKANPMAISSANLAKAPAGFAFAEGDSVDGWVVQGDDAQVTTFHDPSGQYWLAVTTRFADLRRLDPASPDGRGYKRQSVNVRGSKGKRIRDAIAWADGSGKKKLAARANPPRGHYVPDLDLGRWSYRAPGTMGYSELPRELMSEEAIGGVESGSYDSGGWLIDPDEIREVWISRKTRKPAPQSRDTYFVMAARVDDTWYNIHPSDGRGKVTAYPVRFKMSRDDIDAAGLG